MRENRNIPFRDWNIRVSRDHSGHLHICAMDVCNILKRSELLGRRGYRPHLPDGIEDQFPEERTGAVEFPAR